MDVQLQELIDKIKKDGVATAESEAEKIINAAEKKAEEIIAKANNDAEEIKKTAKNETERMEKSSEEAIIQAGRNMLLSFKDSLISELNGIVLKETEKAMTKELLSKIIPETVKSWVKNNQASDLSILLNEKDLKSLESTFTAELKNEISKGVEIKPDKTLSVGFKIGINNGAAYYDYSAESLAELFSAYLNPKVADLMKQATKGTN